MKHSLIDIQRKLRSHRILSKILSDDEYKISINEIRDMLTKQFQKTDIYGRTTAIRFTSNHDGRYDIVTIDLRDKQYSIHSDMTKDEVDLLFITTANPSASCRLNLTGLLNTY